MLGGKQAYHMTHWLSAALTGVLLWESEISAD